VIENIVIGGPTMILAAAKKRHRSADEARRLAVDAEERRRWRCLLLVIKAKLESVADAVETFDEAFLELPEEILVTSMREHQKMLPIRRDGALLPAFLAVCDQTGDPKGDGSGGSGKKLKAEFSREQHVRGIVSMARRANDDDSADSQFFICLASAPYLDGQYTIWGKVVSGMEFVDKIKAGSASNNGAVVDPTKIIKMRVAADVKE